MVKPDDLKAEAFAIKMEELIKQALSEELQDMTYGDEDQPVDLATNNDDDEALTEEEMIRIVKKEPNEKPLSVKNFIANPALVEEELESELLEPEQPTDSDDRHILIQSSQENTEDSGEDTSSPQNPSTTTVPDMTTPAPEPPIEQLPNEPVYMDLEAMYEESFVDTKPTSAAKSEYYTSVECKSCQITFNDNYGFRRHLNHVHPHNHDQTVTSSNEDVSQENVNVRRSLRSKSTPITTAPSPSPPKALHKKNLKCNVKFKQQFRANLKLKHLKAIPLPEKYEKPAVDIQCRFCEKGGWKESEYRLHLLQRHSQELNPLSKQITDSNSKRLKETEVGATANNTVSTSSRPSTSTNDSPTPTTTTTTTTTTTDPDIIMLDIPYDPIKDISENQRRTYQFFQDYMLDIS